MPYSSDDTSTLLSDATSTVTGAAKFTTAPIKTFQIVGNTTSDSGACSVVVEVSNNGTEWITGITLGLTLGTAKVTDGAVMNAPWRYIRGRVVSISGTGAKVSLFGAY